MRLRKISAIVTSVLAACAIGISGTAQAVHVFDGSVWMDEHQPERHGYSCETNSFLPNMYHLRTGWADYYSDFSYDKLSSLKKPYFDKLAIEWMTYYPYNGSPNYVGHQVGSAVNSAVLNRKLEDIGMIDLSINDIPEGEKYFRVAGTVMDPTNCAFYFSVFSGLQNWDTEPGTLTDHYWEPQGLPKYFTVYKAMPDGSVKKLFQGDADSFYEQEKTLAMDEATWAENDLERPLGHKPMVVTPHQVLIFDGKNVYKVDEKGISKATTLPFTPYEVVSINGTGILLTESKTGYTTSGGFVGTRYFFDGEDIILHYLPYDDLDNNNWNQMTSVWLGDKWYRQAQGWTAISAVKEPGERKDYRDFKWGAFVPDGHDDVITTRTIEKDILKSLGVYSKDSGNRGNLVLLTDHSGLYQKGLWKTGNWALPQLFEITANPPLWHEADCDNPGGWWEVPEQPEVLTTTVETKEITMLGEPGQPVEERRAVKYSVFFSVKEGYMWRSENHFEKYVKMSEVEAKKTECAAQVTPEPTPTATPTPASSKEAPTPTTTPTPVDQQTDANESSDSLAKTGAGIVSRVGAVLAMILLGAGGVLLRIRSRTSE